MTGSQNATLHLGGFLQLCIVLDHGIQVHHLTGNRKQEAQSNVQQNQISCWVLDSPGRGTEVPELPPTWPAVLHQTLQHTEQAESGLCCRNTGNEW